MICRYIFLCFFAVVGHAIEKFVCETQLDTLTCPIGNIIQIDYVLYGRIQSGTCNPGGQTFRNLNCRSSQISTDAVVNNCQGRTGCVIMASNSILGEDPCPNDSKYLQIRYQCVITLTSTLPPLVTQSTVISTTQATTIPVATTTATTITTTATQAVTSRPVILPSSIGSNGNQSVHTCNEYLVSGPRGIPDSQLSASSQVSLSNNAHRARLFLEASKYPNGFYLEGGWTADSKDQQPWLQVKMNWLTIIKGITTQGRHVNADTGCCLEWTTKYMIRHSNDGQTWDMIMENGQPKIFIGNTDSDTPITNMFDCPFTARFVRVEVQGYVGNASLRVEFIGCPTNTDDIGQCPNGWKERPASGTCYFISDQTDKKSWENAMLTCKRRQSDIVKIDSIQELIWLQTELQVLQQSQKLDTFWIGLNNRPRFDNINYVWEDGNTLDTKVLNWNPLEPDNVGGKEHCAAYLLNTNNLSDMDCDLSFPFICEIQKYWLQPLNASVLVAISPPSFTQITNQPTPATTLAPATMKYGVPIPIGGTAVTVGLSTFTTGCLNAGDCAGRAWKDYPSCSGCGYFLTCAPSGAFDRKCPLNLKFDDNVDTCSATSSTCIGP